MGMPSSDQVQLGKQERGKRKEGSESERREVGVGWGAPSSVKIAFSVLQTECASAFVF